MSEVEQQLYWTFTVISAETNCGRYPSQWLPYYHQSKNNKSVEFAQPTAWLQKNTSVFIASLNLSTLYNTVSVFNYILPSSDVYQDLGITEDTSWKLYYTLNQLIYHWITGY